MLFVGDTKAFSHKVLFQLRTAFRLFGCKDTCCRAVYDRFTRTFVIFFVKTKTPRKANFARHKSNLLRLLRPHVLVAHHENFTSQHSNTAALVPSNEFLMLEGTNLVTCPWTPSQGLALVSLFLQGPVRMDTLTVVNLGEVNV